MEDDVVARMGGRKEWGPVAAEWSLHWTVRATKIVRANESVRASESVRVSESEGVDAPLTPCS